jgi:hypothetical protein
VGISIIWGAEDLFSPGIWRDGVIPVRFLLAPRGPATAQPYSFFSDIEGRFWPDRLTMAERG